MCVCVPPQETIAALVTSIQCGQQEAVTSSCVCPVDYAQGSNCTQPRPYTCTAAIATPGAVLLLLCVCRVTVVVVVCVCACVPCVCV